MRVESPGTNFQYLTFIIYKLTSIVYNNHVTNLMNKNTTTHIVKNNWSVKFGAVKSIDVSDVHFKPKVKANPYIRNKTYLKRPSINLKAMSNSEAY